MNDLISREATLNALGERPMVWTSDDDYSLGERNQYDIDRLAIETVPSEDIDLSDFSDNLWRAAYERGKAEEVRHGKWLHGQGFAGNYFDCLVCDQCKKESMAKTNYCPNCGARME